MPGYVYRCHDEDGEWCTQFASDGIYELTGYYAADFLKGGKHAYGWLVHPADKKKLSEVVRKAIRDRQTYKIVYRIKTASEDEKWVWEQGQGVYNSNSELIATEGFIIDITEKKIAEDEIIKRNKELAALNKISLALSKLANKDEIFDLIYDMTSKLFSNKNVFIAYYNSNDETISFPIYYVNGQRINYEPRKFGNGLTEYIISNKQPLLLNSNIELNFNLLGINLIGGKSKSLISVPMLAGEKITGVITLQDYENENVFAESDLDILTTIASQAAIALENSRLYETLQIELDEKRIAENKLVSSLKEKEILLQEVHHRVKNNLQIMSSLLRLQSTYLQHTEAKQYFVESENRIKSMAIIHNKLYNSKNYESIDFCDYIKTLVNNLILTYRGNGSDVTVNMDVDDIIMNIDTAIPCGLIINELVSNSLKYAFPEKEAGIININLEKDKDERYILTINDNGIGIPNDFDISNLKSLGMKLVSLLTNQIGGKLFINKAAGTEFQIHFNEVKYKERTK